MSATENELLRRIGRHLNRYLWLSHIKEESRASFFVSIMSAALAAGSLAVAAVSCQTARSVQNDQKAQRDREQAKQLVIHSAGGDGRTYIANYGRIPIEEVWVKTDARFVDYPWARIGSMPACTQADIHSFLLQGDPEVAAGFSVYFLDSEGLAWRKRSHELRLEELRTYDYSKAEDLTKALKPIPGCRP